MQFSDFSFSRGETYDLVVNMVPPTNITNRTIEALTTRCFGNTSGLITKSCASGFISNESGITVNNAATGKFTIHYRPIDTSGFEYGNYATRITFTDTPVTVVCEGFMGIYP